MRIGFSTAFRIYDELKSHHQLTFTQLNNKIKAPESTLSLALQQLKSECLIERVIVNDEPYYVIAKDNFIERITLLLNKKNKTKKEKINLALLYFGLLIIQTKFPKKHSISYHYLEEKINLSSSSLQDYYNLLIDQHPEADNVFKKPPYNLL